MQKINEIFKKYIPDGFEMEENGKIAGFKVPTEKIEKVCNDLYFVNKLPLKTITAVDEKKQGFKIFYLFGVPGENVFLAPYIVVSGKNEFPSITRFIHEASGYERRIKTFFGLDLIGHPHVRPMTLHENWPDTAFPLRKDFDWNNRPAEASGKYEFRKVEGEGVYEIPVGPVHAGIIEPGHFRFSVLGEEILLLEAKLGYKHKGIEKLFEILPLEEKIKLSERVSGDTSFTHSLAFCQAVEDLAKISVPLRAKFLRVIFSELERLANHFNDIGFILLDTGYSFGGSNCSRLREIVMQWNERLSKNRFLRGINTVGGVNININHSDSVELLKVLKKLQKDFDEVIDIAENSSSVANRLNGTGRLNYQIALDHGVLGLAGRASGIEHDARIEYPYAVYDKLKFEMALEKEGDVKARWMVRVKEVRSSLSILKQALENIPADKELKSHQKISLKNDSYSVGITEGWRGEIVYFVFTNSEGQISRVDVRDPSFVNWTVLGHSGKGNIVPDFPLINKSFNLSYSGNDL